MSRYTPHTLVLIHRTNEGAKMALNYLNNCGCSKPAEPSCQKPNIQDVIIDGDKVTVLFADGSYAVTDPSKVKDRGKDSITLLENKVSSLEEKLASLEKIINDIDLAKFVQKDSLVVINEDLTNKPLFKAVKLD